MKKEKHKTIDKVEMLIIPRINPLFYHIVINT